MFGCFLFSNGILLYYQVFDGYKPNPEIGVDDIKYVLEVSFNYGMSDRKFGTHSWYLAPTWNAGNPTAQNIVWIPSYETDYGTLSIPGNPTYMFNNVVDNFRINFYKEDGSILSDTISLNGYDIEALPVYPANLNDWSAPFILQPSSYPGWRFYEVFARTGSTQSSVKYRFYNAAVYGWGRHIFRVVRMASWLIAGIGVVYLLIAVQLLVEGKIGLGIAFLGYALGNVGLYLAAR